MAAARVNVDDEKQRPVETPADPSFVGVQSLKAIDLQKMGVSRLPFEICGEIVKLQDNCAGVWTVEIDRNRCGRSSINETSYFVKEMREKKSNSGVFVVGTKVDPDVHVMGSISASSSRSSLTSASGSSTSTRRRTHRPRIVWSQKSHNTKREWGWAMTPAIAVCMEINLDFPVTLGDDGYGMARRWATYSAKAVRRTRQGDEAHMQLQWIIEEFPIKHSDARRRILSIDTAIAILGTTERRDIAAFKQELLSSACVRMAVSCCMHKLDNNPHRRNTEDELPRFNIRYNLCQVKDGKDHWVPGHKHVLCKPRKTKGGRQSSRYMGRALPFEYLRYKPDGSEDPQSLIIDTIIEQARMWQHASQKSKPHKRPRGKRGGRKVREREEKAAARKAQKAARRKLAQKPDADEAG